ncbi:hypothetical protein [Staphylococcus phage PT94]
MLFYIYNQSYINPLLIIYYNKSQVVVNKKMSCTSINLSIVNVLGYTHHP